MHFSNLSDSWCFHLLNIKNVPTKNSFQVSSCTHSPINVLILNIQHFNMQVCITMREKNSPARPSIISACVMSAAFPVYTYRVYLSTVCVRECAFAGATVPSESALTPVSSLCGPCRVVIGVKPFEAGLIASCMTVWWGVFPLRIDFIMSVTLSPTLGAIYVCHFFILMLPWPAPALSVRRHGVFPLLLNNYSHHESILDNTINLFSVGVCSHVNNIYVQWIMHAFLG